MTSSDVHVSYGIGLDTDSMSPLSVETQNHSSRSRVLLRRRTSPANTFKTVDDCDELDTYGALPGWQPGSEPGYDPKLADGGHAFTPTLNAECAITVVDFSMQRMVKRHFNNASFIAFLEKPKESWAKCRWINVNGLSWDVIQTLGTEKGLHKLALEDTMNLRNRTKADW